MIDVDLLKLTRAIDIPDVYICFLNYAYYIFIK
jgi:hypothetical protein